MSPLQAELNRLYFTDESTSPHGDGDASALITADGRVRAIVLELARPTDWASLATVWRGVQTDLDLPAPAIAVSGVDGHQLWFSLEQPVAVADAQAFLGALCARYLSAVEPLRIGRMPCLDAATPSKTSHARLVPAVQAETGYWSAFVSADLAAIFTDEPWLDHVPNPDAQARLLSPLACIPLEIFYAVLEKIRLVAVPTAAPSAPAAVLAPLARAYSPEPRRFLMDVMNDPAVDLHLRIEAAKALLPYGDGHSSH